MNRAAALELQIQRILRDDMAIDVPSPHTDLLESGHLDSLLLAELLSRLEAELAFRVRIEDLDLDQLRTIAALARFALSHQGETAGHQAEMASPARGG